MKHVKLYEVWKWRSQYPIHKLRRGYSYICYYRRYLPLWHIRRSPATSAADFLTVEKLMKEYLLTVLIPWPDPEKGPRSPGLWPPTKRGVSHQIDFSKMFFHLSQIGYEKSWMIFVTSRFFSNELKAPGSHGLEPALSSFWIRNTVNWVIQDTNFAVINCLRNSRLLH